MATPKRHPFVMRWMAHARAAWTPERALLAAQLAAIGLTHVGVSAVLRLLWLGRPDPYGKPLVGKLDWYWFHAIALDSWQACRVVALGVLIAVLAGRDARGHRWSRGIVLTSFVLLTALSVLDAEVMRFMGMHISPTLVRTYANSAALRELPSLLAHDAGIAFLGLALLFAAPVAVALLARRAMSRVRSTRPALGFSVLVMAGYLYAFVLWQGGFREWRLEPPLDVMRKALAEPDAVTLSPEALLAASAAHARRFFAGGPADQRFPLPDYPLYHVTNHVACRDGFATGTACAADGDGDEIELRADCDDGDASVHPGAVDTPTDGIDQDCDGVDARPPNVLLLVLETHRALDVGHLLAPKDRPSSTPHLDALAQRGLTFTRAVANGTPTVNAFMALHTSLLPHPHKTVASNFTHVGIRGLPDILREHGYYTRFFSAADPAWDNQTAWLRTWYDDVDYDRSREQDGPLFEHVARWFESEWTARSARSAQPFFVAAMTRTNHYPFHRVEGVGTTGGDSMPERIADTMRYTDAQMGRLLERLARAPWWKDTVVIVTGDHGFPMGEHGYSRLHETVHVEATGVPIVLSGGHPEVARWAGTRSDAAASHIDIAPTVLDLAGIDPSGAFCGRSLLQERGERVAPVITDREWALGTGAFRVLVRPVASEPPHDARWFDRMHDPLERAPLAASARPAHAAALEQELRAIAPWIAYLYEHDRLWPPDAAPAHRPQYAVVQ